MTRVMARQPGLQRAIAAAGSVSHLARIVGLQQSTVAGWTRIPVRHVLVIADQLAIPRSQLRPDIYPPNREG